MSDTSQTSEAPLNLAWCIRCQDNLPAENFFKNKATKNGLTKYCKQCFTRKKEDASAGRRVRLKTKAGKLIANVSHQPQKIQEIAKYMMESPKITLEELSLKVGLTVNSTYEYMRSNQFLKSLRVEGKKRASLMIPKALNALDESLEARSEEVKLKAAKTLLDSEKVLGPQQIDVNVNDLSLKSFDELVEMMEAIKIDHIKPTIMDAELIQ